MNQSILITRPNFDKTTRYLSAWAEIVINFAKTKGFKILNLAGHRANEKELRSMVIGQNPAIIFLNGHGNENKVAGQDNGHLVEGGVNESLLAGTIVYALACRSGKILGPKSIASGALSYVGYVQDFVFFIDESKLTRPIEDGVAKLFLEPSNYFLISLIKGHNVGESFNRSRDLFYKNFRKELISESTLNTTAISFLAWNYKYQVCLGDRNARVI